MTKDKLLTRKKFSELVRVNMSEKGISAIESTIDVCETRTIEIETVKRLIDKSLKALIEQEAVALNMVEGDVSPLEKFLG